MLTCYCHFIPSEGVIPQGLRPIFRVYKLARMFILDMEIITKYDNRHESHWRELNSRPTPYQGVAIPLSHSGVVLTNRDFGLIATEKNPKISFEN